MEYSEYLSNIGNLIKSKREKKKLTIYQVAKKAGVRWPTVKNAESGKVITTLTLFKISKALNCSFNLKVPREVSFLIKN